MLTVVMVVAVSLFGAALLVEFSFNNAVTIFTQRPRSADFAAVPSVRLQVAKSVGECIYAVILGLRVICASVYGRESLIDAFS